MSSGDAGSWIDIAEEDLASAKKLASPPDPRWRTAVYHCQQAAEKALKALLVFHGGRLTKKLEKHDIGFLLEKVSHYGIDVGGLEVLAESLTDLGTTYRYPGLEVEPLTEKMVDKAIADAEHILTKSKQLIAAADNDGGGDGAGGGAAGGPPPKP